MISSSDGRLGCQRRTSRARSALATRTGGSPARRGPTACGTSWPTSRAVASSTSRMLKPPPLPRLQTRGCVRAAVPGRGRLEREQVRVGEVRDVDVVADARPVGRRVVVAEDRQRRAALGGREDVRDEVRLGVVVLAERLRGPGDVEVAQRHAAQPVRPAVPLQRRLERALRLAVRVDRPEWRVLGDRRLVGRAVDRGRRGEDEPLHARLARGLQQRDPARDVVAVVRAPGRGSTHRRASVPRNGGSPRSAR